MNSIFVKKEPKNINRKILSKDEILASIPKNALKEKNTEHTLTHDETRWRIFQLPNHENEIIEISKKKPNEERLYMNQNGSWILYDGDDKFDVYVVDEFYYYSVNE